MRNAPSHSRATVRSARRSGISLAGVGSAAALLLGACTNSGGTTSTGPASAGLDSTTASEDTAAPAAASAEGDESLPTAPESARVDLSPPTFSDPTNVDNPLFPISNLHSAVLLGNVDGHPLRIETTLLAEPKTIDVDGEPVESLESQFVAYVDGRIHEVALDWYAQDYAGAVWYFGEDVFNYENGVVADTDGTWLAGEDGPVAMIMPADPQVGDVYRPENVPDSIFEEVTVTSVGLTVDGPEGAVEGAIIGQENHVLEGVYEDKTFAPGYGEFFSGVGPSLEAMALAAPTDALPGGVPTEVAALSSGAAEIIDAAQAGDWEAEASALDEMQAAWDAHQAGGDVPPLLAIQMNCAMEAMVGDALVPAVDGRNVEGARQAALDVALASIDLELQYRPPGEIDADRFGIWTRQLVADASSVDPEPGNVAGDVATLEWIWDRIELTLDDALVAEIENHLDVLRTAADDEDTAAAADAATQLVETLAVLDA